jgi:hypothetical protein
MENCLQGYTDAHKMFMSEKYAFMSRLNEIKAQGGDIYAHLNH